MSIIEQYFSIMHKSASIWKTKTKTNKHSEIIFTFKFKINVLFLASNVA